MNRCPWLTTNEIYLRCHDEEWGTPVHDDHKHFEFLVLESAQAGLSWSTPSNDHSSSKFTNEQGSLRWNSVEIYPY